MLLNDITTYGRVEIQEEDRKNVQIYFDKMKIWESKTKIAPSNILRITNKEKAQIQISLYN